MDKPSSTGPPWPEHAPDETPAYDALRSAKDRGAGTGKVRFPDPWAACLGADYEAAGTPPTPELTFTAAHALSPPAHPDRLRHMPQPRRLASG